MTGINLLAIDLSGALAFLPEDPKTFIFNMNKWYMCMDFGLEIDSY